MFYKKQSWIWRLGENTVLIEFKRITPLFIRECIDPARVDWNALIARAIQANRIPQTREPMTRECKGQNEEQ